MYKRKRLKKRLMGGIAIVVALLIAGLSLAVMAKQQENQLLAYARSLGNLPEVGQVLAISEFVSHEPAIVARVELVSGEEHLYFIQEDTVVLQLPASEILAPAAVMNDVFGTTEIVRYSLGLYGERAIYELVANTESGVNYVWVDARTGDIILSFVLD